jgi:hypothetical protein
MMSEKQDAAPRHTASAAVYIVAALSAVVGFAAVYGTLDGPDNADLAAPPEPAAVNLADEVNSEVSGASTAKGGSIPAR